MFPKNTSVCVLIPELVFLSFLCYIPFLTLGGFMTRSEYDKMIEEEYNPDGFKRLIRIGVIFVLGIILFLYK